jgi:hypothetical protein
MSTLTDAVKVIVTDLGHGHHLVSLEFFCEPSVDALVEENSHEALASMRALASSRKAIT